MSRKWRNVSRTCLACGQDSGGRRYCGPCDPTRPARGHVDKYAPTARAFCSDNRTHAT